MVSSLVDVAIGRKAGLQGSFWEGPECAAKPPFHCEREIAFNAQRRPCRAFFVLEIALAEFLSKSKSPYSKGALEL